MFVRDAVGCYVNLDRCDWVDAIPGDGKFSVCCGVVDATRTPAAGRKLVAILRTFTSLPEAETYLRSLFVHRHPVSLEPSWN